MNVLTALDDERSTTRSLAALRWLTEVAETLADATSLEELARASEEVLRKHSGAERDGLYLIDFTRPASPLRLLFARGFTEQERQTAEATAADRHPGWVVRTGQSLWVPDTRLQAPDSPSKDSPGGGESRSRLWLPVARDGEVFGAFGFASSTPNAFDAADREVLTLVAQLAATAYRRLRAEHVATLERRRAADAEHALARNRFAALLGAIPDAVIGAAHDGRIAYWNDAASALFGQTAHLALGQPLAALIPGLGEPTDDSTVREIEIVRADGQTRPADLRMSPIADLDQQLVVYVLRDASERRRQQADRERESAEARRHDAVLLTVHDSADLTLPALLTKLTRELVRALDVDRVGVWQVAPPNADAPAADAIIALHQHDRADGSHTSGQRLDARAFPAYFAALRTDAAIVAEDAHAHPATAAFGTSYLAPLGVASMLDVPLRALDGLRGVMCVEARSPRTWRAAEIALCEEVGRLIMQAVERVERRALESRHAAILASIGDAVVACDLGGVITLVNPVAETLTGWSATRAIGQPLAAVVQLEPAAGRDAEPHLVDAVLATGQPQALHSAALLRRRDGSATPVAARATPLGHAGALGGAVLTFRDVTTEQRTQRSLELQHARLRSISEALPDLLFTVTRDGRLRLKTRADHADLLVPAHEIPDHTIRTLFPADVADELLAKIARVIDSGQVESVEYKLTGPAGRQWFEARMARLGADEVTCIVRNVSEVREQLAAQREQRARLATVLESTSAMMYAAMLPTFELDYLSDSAHAVIGYALEQFADPAFWHDRLHPEDRDRVLTESADLTTRGHLAREYRFRHADGRWVWLHDELRVVRDERGEPVRAIGAAFDVTSRKQDERRLAMLVAMQAIVTEVAGAYLAGTELAASAVRDAALTRIGELAGAERVRLYGASDGAVALLHGWPSPAPGEAVLTLDALPWLPAARAAPGALWLAADQLASSGARSPRVEPDARTGALAALAQIEPGRDLLIVIDSPAVEPLGRDDFGALLKLFVSAVATGTKGMADERALRSLNQQLAMRTARQQALLDVSTELAHTTSRADLLDRLRDRLRTTLGTTLGVVRLSLVELREGGGVELTAVDATSAGAIEPVAVDGQRSDDGPLDDFAETAIAHALATCLPVTTREHAHTRFRDWSHLHARLGTRQFVVVPLVSATGPFGTLNVALRDDEPPDLDDVAWLAQVGGTMAAHLARQAAEAQRSQLLAELEHRVDERTRQLRASEERFETLFQHAPQALLMFDVEGRIVQSNRSARSLFGYDEARFLGLPADALLPPESRHGHAALMRIYTDNATMRAMAQGRVVTALRQSGETFAAEIGLVPLDVSGTRQVLAGLTDVSARVAAQAEIARSLDEKETLLKEIHHRVKNNLQIVSSLLMLQSEMMPSPAARAMLEESVYRVRSMALIHEQLYSFDSLARIELGAYARTLGESLRTTLAPHATLGVVAAPVEVSVELAVPIGLILNELLTNAFKYGVPAHGAARADGAARPDVVVELDSAPAHLTLTVIDRGPGLPAGFDPARGTTLGMQIVRSLTRQLRARLTVNDTPGARFTVVCPRQPSS